MSSNLVPGPLTRPVFANSRCGPLVKAVCSAGYPGLTGSATTPNTTCNGATWASLTRIPVLHGSTDSPSAVANDADRPFGRVEVCPDVLAGPVFPVLVP